MAAAQVTDMVKSGGALRLGPVARKLINPDRWRGEYPAHPEYSRELDALLHFAKQNGYFKRFEPNIENKDRQRDKALSELRLAYLFTSLGFGIRAWDPPGANGMTGEFVLSSSGEPDVFVEIKSRGWESELTQAQKDAGLAKLLKYDVWKGGAVGNWQAVHACISSDNCYPKFLPMQPNLLIMADDLNVALHDSLFQVQEALFGEMCFFGEDGYFTTNRFENIGGLGIFNFGALSRGVEYEFIVFRNPNALPATQLPSSWNVYEKKFMGIVKGTDSRRGIMYL
jgi:hypothetical protein